MQKTEFYALAVLISICFAKNSHVCVDRAVQQESGKIVCEDCMLCGAGYQVHPPCHSGQVYYEETLKEETCVPCKDGEYKQISHGKNNSLSCQPCNASSCGNYAVLSPCTKTSPVKCSEKCKDGYHKNDFGNCVLISSSSTAKTKNTPTTWKESTTTVNTPNDDARSSKKHTPTVLKEVSNTTNTPKDYTKSSIKDAPTTWKKSSTTMETPKDYTNSSIMDPPTTGEKSSATMKTPNNTKHVGNDSSDSSGCTTWCILVILAIVLLVILVVIMILYFLKHRGNKSSSCNEPKKSQGNGHTITMPDDDTTQSENSQEGNGNVQETTSFINSSKSEVTDVADSSDGDPLLGGLATSSHQPTESVNRAQRLKKLPEDGYCRCGKDAGQMLHKIPSIDLKMEHLSNHFPNEEEACNKIFNYLNNTSYPNNRIKNTGDLFKKLCAEVGNLTLAKFMKALDMTGYSGVHDIIHDEFHPKE